MQRTIAATGHHVKPKRARNKVVGTQQDRGRVLIRIQDHDDGRMLPPRCHRPRLARRKNDARDPSIAWLGACFLPFSLVRSSGESPPGVAS
jgi:hypothetical protein